MIETLYLRDEATGSYRIGIASLPELPSSAAYGHAGLCACYYVRLRVLLFGSLPVVVKLAVPYIPRGRLLPTLATFNEDLRAIVQLLRQQITIEDNTPIELLDFSFVTFAHVDDADAITNVEQDEPTTATTMVTTWTLTDNTGARTTNTDNARTEQGENDNGNRDKQHG